MRVVKNTNSGSGIAVQFVVTDVWDEAEPSEHETILFETASKRSNTSGITHLTSLRPMRHTLGLPTVCSHVVVAAPSVTTKFGSFAATW